MSTDKWATSKSTQLSTKVWVKLLLLLKTQFWGPLTENLNPLQRPTNILTPSSINTQNRSKNYIWIYHGMHWTLCYRQKNSLSHWKARNWLPVAFKKCSRHTHQNSLKLSPVSERSANPLQNYVCFFPLTSAWVREFWPQMYIIPLTGPGLRPTVQNSS